MPEKITPNLEDPNNLYLSLSTWVNPSAQRALLERDLARNPTMPAHIAQQIVTNIRSALPPESGFAPEAVFEKIIAKADSTETTEAGVEDMLVYFVELFRLAGLCYGHEQLSTYSQDVLARLTDAAEQGALKREDAYPTAALAMRIFNDITSALMKRKSPPTLQQERLLQEIGKAFPPPPQSPHLQHRAPEELSSALRSHMRERFAEAVQSSGYPTLDDFRADLDHSPAHVQEIAQALRAGNYRLAKAGSADTVLAILTSGIQNMHSTGESTFGSPKKSEGNSFDTYAIARSVGETKLLGLHAQADIYSIPSQDLPHYFSVIPPTALEDAYRFTAKQYGRCAVYLKAQAHQEHLFLSIGDSLNNHVSASNTEWNTMPIPAAEAERLAPLLQDADDRLPKVDSAPAFTGRILSYDANPENPLLPHFAPPFDAKLHLSITAEDSSAPLARASGALACDYMEACIVGSRIQPHDIEAVSIELSATAPETRLRIQEECQRLGIPLIEH